jgi:DNA-binding NarL/FixJ family response regulator
MMTKVLIAEDHPLFREAMRDVLGRLFQERGSGFVCIEAATKDDVFDVAEREEDLDLVLLDLFMPGAHGLEELVALRAKVPATPIVVISSLSDPATMRRAMACGAAGFIPKSSSKQLIAKALEVVFEGGVYVPRELLAEQTAIDGTDEAHSEPMTARQLAVLGLLADGKSNKEIARELAISDVTVKAHVTAVLRKLGVATRAQAIVAFRSQQPEANP